MTNRRNFIKQVSAAGILSSIPGFLLSHKNFMSVKQKSSDDLIWSILLHLSYNMWEDHIPAQFIDENYKIKTCDDARQWAHGYRPNLTFDDGLWNDLLKAMVNAGMNMVLIDLRNSVKYESHPEIAVNNAWSTKRLRNELAKIRKMGLEPIPKLNFALDNSVIDRALTKQERT